MHTVSSPLRRHLLVAILLLAACGDSTAPERGGAYTATLIAPAGRLDGAAVIELSGTGIESVTARSGSVYSEHNGDVLRVVVINDAPGPISFGVQLARGSRVPRATVLEVADGADSARASLVGYAVSFGR